MRGRNDTEEALWDIAAALDRVEPDEVHLLVPTRPTAESWVSVPDPDALKRAETKQAARKAACEAHDSVLTNCVLRSRSHPVSRRIGLGDNGFHTARSRIRVMAAGDDTITPWYVRSPE